MLINRVSLMKPSHLSCFLTQIIDSRQIAVNNPRQAQRVTGLYNEKGSCHNAGGFYMAESQGSRLCLRAKLGRL